MIKGDDFNPLYEKGLALNREIEEKRKAEK